MIWEFILSFLYDYHVQYLVNFEFRRMLTIFLEFKVKDSDKAVILKIWQIVRVGPLMGKMKVSLSKPKDHREI